MRILFVLMVVFMTINAQAAEHGKWDMILGQHVQNGLVDYESIAKEDGPLRKYLHQLSITNFKDLSDQARLAYLVNAYNAYTIALIIDNTNEGKLVSSIKDIGGFFSSPWKKRICDLDGKKYSLDEIEHKLIRKKFKDPRVHFALNCASVSCPPLASFAYEAENLDEQFESQTAAFINNPVNTYVKDNTLYLSKIFNWYKDDFTSGVRDFIKLYATGDLATQIAQHNKISLSYLPYNWSLNIIR